MSILSKFDLKGKTAVVTGCSRGIGEAMAVALAEAGADIIGISSGLGAGSAVENSVTALGQKFTAHRADLSKREEIYRLVSKIQDVEPRIDILVNNAGTIRRSPAVDHADEDWDQVLRINLDAPFILAKEIGRKMLEAGTGKIIFTCSLLTFQGGILVPGYAASKGAVGSLVKALANEWAGKGVNVNGIAPGYIETDNTEALRKDPERSQSIMSRIPAGRWGKPEDLKGAVVYLASAASDYVHGEILTVDGGWMGR